MQHRQGRGRARTLVTIVAVAAMSVLQMGAVTRLESDHPSEADWFVGKGDLQSAFGWSAKDTDTKSETVVFTYMNVETRTFDCIADNGLNGWRKISVVADTTDTTETTTRATAYETRTSGRKTTTSVTGVWVTLSGTPVKTTTTEDCPATWTDTHNELQGGAGTVYSVTKAQNTMVRTVHEELHATSGGGRKATTAVIWTGDSEG